MNVKHLLRAIPLLLLAMSLVGCSGAGGAGIGVAASGGSGGGIGGTGLTSSGTIDGFGSIFVNGVEFETENAEILVDGQSVGEEALGLGMVVRVTGNVNDNGVTGTASRIVFDDEVQGPVQAIQRAQDGDSILITVLGVDVIVERTGTVFEGLSFVGVQLGDVVEVSGFFETQGRLRATRLEKKETFSAGVSEVEVKGVISGVNGTEFTLREFTVDFSGADISELSGGTPADGMTVQVKGTLDPQIQLIRALRVEQEKGIETSFHDGKEASVQGSITNFVSIADFRLDGVPVDASGATLRPSDLILGNGMVVEAEGNWENGVLRAGSIEGRRGRVEIEATVAAVDVMQKSLSMQLQGGSITIYLDSRTMLDDDTDGLGRLVLADIRAGDFLDIEALRVGDRLFATRIDKETPHEEVLQAPLESFAGEDSITVLGITYSTMGAEFRARDELPLSQAQFYAALEMGMLVKVKDNAPADGIADRVELEYEGALDGERDFERDDGLDENSGSDDEVGEPDEQDEADEVEKPEGEAEKADNPDEIDNPDELDSPDEPDEPVILEEPENP